MADHASPVVGGAGWVRLLLLALVAGPASCASAPEPPGEVPEAAVEPAEPAPEREPPTTDPVVALQEFLATRPETGEILQRVVQLGMSEDPRAVQAIASILRRPGFEDCVYEFACVHIVDHGGPVAGKALAKFADSRLASTNPRLMVRALEAIGVADPDGQYPFLLKVGRKHLDRDAEVAIAAYKAAAGHVTPDSVDDFVKELQVADAVRPRDTEQQRACRAEVRQVLDLCLLRMTGRYIDDARVWLKWWKDNRKTWMPLEPGEEHSIDINASDTFVDDAYGIVIKKANKTWWFLKDKADFHGIVTIEALDEGQRAAWIEISAEETRNLKSETPEAYAEETRGSIEPRFRDIRRADWTKKGSYGGLKGIEQVVEGVHKDYDLVQMRNVFLEKRGVMYVFRTIWKSGKKASLKDDIETMLDGFRCLR